MNWLSSKLFLFVLCASYCPFFSLAQADFTLRVYEFLIFFMGYDQERFYNFGYPCGSYSIIYQPDLGKLAERLTLRPKRAKNYDLPTELGITDQKMASLFARAMYLWTEGVWRGCAISNLLFIASENLSLAHLYRTRKPRAAW